LVKPPVDDSHAWVCDLVAISASSRMFGSAFSNGIVKLPALVFNGRMNMPTIQPLSYSGYRFPAVIISHCTWLYFRFALSYRDVAEMMAERGVTVSYETIREWSQKFGGTYAKRMRSNRHRLGDRWHLDEVFLTINGKLQYLWR